MRVRQSGHPSASGRRSSETTCRTSRSSRSISTPGSGTSTGMRERVKMQMTGASYAQWPDGAVAPAPAWMPKKRWRASQLQLAKRRLGELKRKPSWKTLYKCWRESRSLDPAVAKKDRQRYLLPPHSRDRDCDQLHHLLSERTVEAWSCRRALQGDQQAVPSPRARPPRRHPVAVLVWPLFVQKTARRFLPHTSLRAQTAHDDR